MEGESFRVEVSLYIDGDDWKKVINFWEKERVHTRRENPGYAYD